uniref:Uncharacterized protein n=1 Tax=Rhizophora mucronata TaxID=61149 RepID=A0A2P2P4C1_RHIMU
MSIFSAFSVWTQEIPIITNTLSHGQSQNGYELSSLMI